MLYLMKSLFVEENKSNIFERSGFYYSGDLSADFSVIKDDLKKNAAKALLEGLIQSCDNLYCATWVESWEFTFWNESCKMITKSNYKNIKNLSKACDGWFIYSQEWGDSDKFRFTFVTLKEWDSYLRNKKKYDNMKDVIQ